MTASKFTFEDYQSNHDAFAIPMFDDDSKPASVEKAKEQLAEGIRIGSAAIQITIGINDVWSAKMKDGGSLQSYEKIGYHARTRELLQGFIASGCPIFVVRYIDGKFETRQIQSAEVATA